LLPGGASLRSGNQIFTNTIEFEVVGEKDPDGTGPIRFWRPKRAVTIPDIEDLIEEVGGTLTSVEALAKALSGAEGRPTRKQREAAVLVVEAWERDGRVEAERSGKGKATTIRRLR